jgi:hypothetical protein
LDVGISAVDKTLVVGIKDEHNDCFRDFPKLLFKAETAVDFAERNKHRGEVEKKRQGFVIQHREVVLTNSWSDRTAERRIADILCFVSGS